MKSIFIWLHLAIDRKTSGISIDAMPIKRNHALYGRKKSYWRQGELKTSHANPHVPSQFHNNLLLLSVIKVSCD